MPSESEPEASETEASSPNRIPLRLLKPHPLINRTLQEQENRKRPEYFGRELQIVDFYASKKQTRTALAILDRFFKALEGQGFEVVLGNRVYGGGSTFARNGRDQCEVRVDEVHKQIAHQITPQEKAQQERGGRKPPKWDSIPTGRFTLSPGGEVDLSTEEAFAACLARSIAAVAEHIEKARGIREVREQSEREEAHRQHLRFEEEQRVKALGESARSLEHYRVLMQYIDEVRRHGVVPNNQLRQNQTLKEWLSWAEAEARRFHPLA